MKYIIALIVAFLLVFTGYKLAEAAVEMTVTAVVKSNPPMNLYKTCDQVQSGSLIEIEGDSCSPLLPVIVNTGSQLETFDPQQAGKNIK